MGNTRSSCKGKHDSKPKLRRIYLGNVPELNDEALNGDGTTTPGAGVGVSTGSLRGQSLKRVSEQSFEDVDKEAIPTTEPSVVPVRRQSILDPEGGFELPSKVKMMFVDNEVRSSRYTLFSFLPRNLFEQFRRIVNFYFLLVAIMQSVIPASPVHPATAIAPLTFVVVVTMIKQGYEDWLRHKADNLFNNRPVKVVRDGILQLIRSKDIRVGDIVKLEGEEQVPADLVLLGSSDEFQRCLLNTANLDGETSLRLRYVPPGLPSLKDEADFNFLSLIIECEEPCEDLYRFNGNILIPPDLPRRDSSVGKMMEALRQLEFLENGTALPGPSGAAPSPSPSHQPPSPRYMSRPESKPTSTPGLLTVEQGTDMAKPAGEKSVQFRDADTLASAAVSGISGSKAASMSGSQHHSECLKKQAKHRRVGVSDFNMVFLGMDNLILRGTKVKNTDFVYGIVVYTGPDTRLARNSTPTAPKFSTVEKSVNKYLISFVFILFVLVIVASTLSILIDQTSDDIWYLRLAKEPMTFYYYLSTFIGFMILFNYIIPISLYVTMEMQKFVGSKFFIWDEDMRNSRGSPPLCNTSDLNEELGQIEYLFSDKTGTLTENVMKTRMFSVNGNIYEVDEKSLLLRDPEDQSKRTEIHVCPAQPALVDFCRALALCHSVQIMPRRRPSVESSGSTVFNELKQKNTKVSTKLQNANSLFTLGGSSKHETAADADILGSSWEYQGSSPDEKALVESCFQLGICFDGEKEDMLTLNVCGKIETYKRHMMLEFDADRKCMSVIVENEKGEIYIITKGAETSIIPRCDSGPVQEVNKHVLNFAMMGLRTLVIAKRKIKRDQLEAYLTRLKAARRLVEDRDEVTKQIYRDIESHFIMVGATGVEDKLQDGVVETLGALGAAGIRVWMLTGDKVETAIAVAYSCGLLTSFSKQIMLTKYTHADKDAFTARLKQIEEEINPDDNTVIIVDGESLDVAFKDCRPLFSQVAMKAFRVVCCRMTPLQKSMVVKMVKQSENKPITAAVGDGANDVAMIQEAHIGLGIIGREGRQAARCADFALHKFGFLRKAILVHGHWYYVRLANLGNYFFYKNIIFVIPQVLFCFDTRFTAQALFHGLFLMFYNIFYSACPILFYGLMEQPYSAKELLNNPHLYKKNSRNSLMTAKVFMKWILFAIWHACCCYYLTYYSWISFYPQDLMSFGTVVFCGVLIVVNMKIAIETVHITWWAVGSNIYSYVLFFFTISLFSEVDLTSIFIDPKNYRYTFFLVLAQPVFWVLMVLITCTALIPDILYKGIEGSWDSVTKFVTTLPKIQQAIFRRKASYAAKSRKGAKRAGRDDRDGHIGEAMISGSIASSLSTTRPSHDGSILGREDSSSIDTRGEFAGRRDLIDAIEGAEVVVDGNNRKDVVNA